MSERDEEDKIVQSGFPVILGGKEVMIAPLVIKYSREWRKKVAKMLEPLPETSKDLETPEDFAKAITTLLVSAQDEVIELFFDYARELDRSKIESVATDAELAQAFKEVIAFGFPLAESPPEALKKIYGIQ